MTTLRNITIAGASGSLGKLVIEALLASGQYNVKALTRKGSDAAFPPSVQVAAVDYNSVDELTAVLIKQDVVIATCGPTALESQIPLIEAAVAAGVKRFIPSEFTADIGNPKARTLPQYAGQLRIQDILQSAANEHPEFIYTSIRNGVFLDWGLAMGFQVDLKSEHPAFYDGGDRPFSTTTLATVAQAVVGVLNHLEETKNRAVYVHDVVTTQRHLLSLARKIAPERRWEPVSVSTENMERKARENLAQGKVDLVSLMGFYCRSVFAEGYGGEFARVDNEMLGLRFKSDADLEIILKGVLQ
ncbi:hypothetical protein BJX68DRAFT_65527 [Aspergillus pseudodeflectus]|uniref:NmrA-like domain-containing protein n=1 Tax=Aspergillus pseudodeflectus TaxID=176178 RepID=A0ABR4KHC2_9EURO